MPEPLDESCDFSPGFACDDGFTFLDLRSVEIDVPGSSLHGDNQSRRVTVCLYAAGPAVYRFEADACTVEFFPNVSRDFQLAFFECGQCHQLSQSSEKR